MTDRELKAEGARRGFKAPIVKAAFVRGYNAAINDGNRENPNAWNSETEKKAYQAGFDVLDELGVKGDIEIDGVHHRAKLQPGADGGFECIVAIRGEDVSCYGETKDAAIAAARARLVVAAKAKAIVNDKVVGEYTVTVDVAGATYDVTQRDYASGRFDLRVAVFPDIMIDGSEDDDQDKAMDTIEQRIAELIGARTVDGAEARVNTKAAPRDQELPFRSAVECAAEVHRLQDECATSERELDEAKAAHKNNELALKAANLALLDAVDREASPQLSLAEAVAS
jgi:hypothetical protein